MAEELFEVLLVDGGQPEFTAAVRALLEDDEQRDRMSAEVTTWVRQFHWDEAVDKWERTLLEAVAAGGRGRGGWSSRWVWGCCWPPSGTSGALRWTPCRRRASP